MTASITETIIENGKSRFIMPLSTVTGVITAQIANISTRLKISDPIMLLIAISLEPAIAADTLTASSGALVPIATIVRPMTTPGTFNFPATAELPSTKKSAPFTSAANPITSNTNCIIIVIFPSFLSAFR